MIGAMPAVTVRHERRKGQDKRSNRPTSLFGGYWLPPTSPSPTPSPNGGVHHLDPDDRISPEYYVCGKVSLLQIIVSSLLLGAIVLIVGLVQLVPNAADADHRYIFLAAGGALLLVGFVVTGVRCVCTYCRFRRQIVEEPPPRPPPPPTHETVNSIDSILVQRRDTQITNPSEWDVLIEDSSKEKEEAKKDHHSVLSPVSVKT